MRAALVLGLSALLLSALPAAAREQDEGPITLALGEKVALKTIFKKSSVYLVTMSGVMTSTAPGLPVAHYDPLFTYRGNCQGATPETNVIFHDSAAAGGHIPNFHGFGQAPARCRADHSYTVRLNDPRIGNALLTGRATVTSRLTEQPNVTGSYTIRIEEERVPPAATIRFGVQARQRFNLIGKSYLHGRGLLAAQTIRDGALGSTARLTPLEAAVSGELPHFTHTHEVPSRRLDLEVRSGNLAITGSNHRIAVVLVVVVVSSDDPKCPPGARGRVTLVEYPGKDPTDEDFVNATLELCSHDEGWSGDDSDVGVTVTRRKS
jgi:hypothetical protein